MSGMKQVSDLADKLETDGGAAERGHDAYVREKVAKGLAESRDRAAMIPVERVLRDLSA